MERTEHKITLDVHKTASSASVSLKKGDTAHRLLITLSEDGCPYHIGEDCTAVFSAVKPDGKEIFNDCTINEDVIIYDLTEQTTAVAGVVNCEIQIYGTDGALLTSASFLLIVEEGASNRSAVVSSDEFGQLRDMFDTAKAVSSTAIIAAERANRAAGACMVIGSASGDMIHLDDAIDAGFVNMSIFGKTTQNGTPTPANPATLVSVGAVGNIKLTSAGKNLITYPYYQSAPTLNGMTYTDNKDGSITVSGTATDYSSYWFTRCDLRLRKGITYTISVSGNYSVTGGSSLLVSSKDKGNIATINLANQKSVSFTPADDYMDVGIYMILTKAGYSLTGTISPQLEVGNVPTQYEVYKGKTITIPIAGGLRGIPVVSGGNYTDANGQQWICDEIDLGRGVYVQRCCEIVATSEMFRNISSYGDSGYYRVSLTFPLKAVQDGSLSRCTHFRTSVAWEGNNEHSYVSGNVGYIFSNQWTTKDAASAWLTSHATGGSPVKFIYVLESPIESGIPDEVIDAYADYIRSHSGDTVVSNDSGAHMALEYIMNARKYIDKMISTGIHEATLE